jgi:hypothetical protein
MDPTGVRMEFEGEGSGLGELNEIPHSYSVTLKRGGLWLLI